MDTKANIEDVNKVLVDVCRELELKASANMLNDALRDQSIVNAGLCADMSFGRWIWRSGKTKTGRGIPWNVQTINSDPDNFVWEKDKVQSCHPDGCHMICECSICDLFDLCACCYCKCTLPNT
jgi:hypothetical protein